MQKGDALVCWELGPALRCCSDFCFDIFVSKILQVMLSKTAVCRKMLIYISNGKKKKCSGPKKNLQNTGLTQCFTNFLMGLFTASFHGEFKALFFCKSPREICYTQFGQPIWQQTKIKTVGLHYHLVYQRTEFEKRLLLPEYCIRRVWQTDVTGSFPHLLSR